MELYGFWSKDIMPIISDGQYIDNFLNKINILYFQVHELYSFNLDLLQDFFKPNIQFKEYCGYSFCRLCGITDNGDKDILLFSSNKTICIPDGYLHYILQHTIFVPIEFQKFIVDFDLDNVIQYIKNIKEFYNDNKVIVQRNNIITNITKITTGISKTKYSN